MEPKEAVKVVVGGRASGVRIFHAWCSAIECLKKAMIFQLARIILSKVALVRLGTRPGKQPVLWSVTPS